MKKLFAQMIDDFEEGVKNLKDDAKKQNNETTKALIKLVKKVDKIAGTTKTSPMLNKPSAVTKSSPSTSSKSSKGKEPPPKQPNEATNKKKKSVNKDKT